MEVKGPLRRHCRQGGAGYTWLDAALDVVGEHGYTILSDNGVGDDPAAILINDEALASARKLIGQLYELGERMDTAAQYELTKIDEQRADITEAAGTLRRQTLEDRNAHPPARCGGLFSVA